jgi:excisionase family DNA binding protein
MTELMTVRQAAQRLEYSSATIRRWIKERKLDHVKFSERGIRIPREAIERLIGESMKVMKDEQSEMRSPRSVGADQGLRIGV